MNMEIITSGPTLNRYSLTVPSCPHALDVLRFEGLEQLSVLYHYSVRFTCSASELAAGMFLNQPALLTMKGGELLHALPVKFVHGVVTHFRRLTGSHDQVSHEIIIEPYLSLLDKQFRTHRFFINKSVPEVVGEILQEHALHGWEYEFTLTQTYPKREQINQYQESDLAFINPMHHLMGDKYIPFLNNQLLELCDPGREMQRKRKRDRFINRVEPYKGPVMVCEDERQRNLLFSKIQQEMSGTLLISESVEGGKNALLRFKTFANEDEEL